MGKCRVFTTTRAMKHWNTRAHHSKEYSGIILRLELTLSTSDENLEKPVRESEKSTPDLKIMGAYLSKPVTDKVSSDEHNEFLKMWSKFYARMEGLSRNSDYDGEEVDHLCREASMPLEEVIAKYSEDGTIHFQSPNIRPRKKIESSSLPENEGCSSSSLVDEFNDSSDP
ncbi:hypothetical protein Avbf_13168 [Armadillidium vulgare]|nr:hypothetical protein Avbf_13168 [Armadillidium vulgare]